MNQNLPKPKWAALESDDLRVLLHDRTGGPGQYSGKLRIECRSVGP